jgi:WD40 repeat protein
MQIKPYILPSLLLVGFLGVSIWSVVRYAQSLEDAENGKYAAKSEAPPVISSGKPAPVIPDKKPDAKDAAKAEEPPTIPDGDPVPTIPDRNPKPLKAVARFGTEPMNFVVYCGSPDGRSYLTSGGGEFVQGRNYPMRLWDADFGKHLLVIEGNWIGVLSAAFSPDGNVVATGGMDNLLLLWDTATGKKIAAHKHSGHVYSVAWSKDGKYIATGSNEVKLWDVKQGKVVRVFESRAPNPKQTEQFMHVALSPDGKLVAAQSQVYYRIWDLGSGEQRQAIEKKEGKRFIDGRLERVFDFSADSKKLMVTVADERSLKVWDTTTWKTEPGLEDVPGFQRLSADYKWLALTEGNVIRVRNLASGKEVKFSLYNAAKSLAFSADGKGLLIAESGTNLLEREVASGEKNTTFFEPVQPIIGLGRAPKGPLIALTQPPQIYWDPAGPRELQIKVWDVAAALELKRNALLLPEYELPDCLSADGKWMLTKIAWGSGMYSTFRVWDVIQRKPVATLDALGDGSRYSVAMRFSPDAKKIAGCTARYVDTDGQTEHIVVAIWDVTSGKVMHGFTVTAGTLAVGFSAGGDKVFTSPFHGPSAGKLRIWEPKTGKIIKVINLPVQDPELSFNRVEAISRIEPSPDGKWVAVLQKVRQWGGKPRPGGAPRWFVKVVDLTTGQEKAAMYAGQLTSNGPGGRVKVLPGPILPPVEWSADSKFVATGSDGAVVVCDATTWSSKSSEERYTRNVTALSWLENNQLVSAADDGTMFLWDPAKAP